MTKKVPQDVAFIENWQDDYRKIIAALANSKGGELIVGLDGRGKPVGLNNIQKLLEEIPRSIRKNLGISTFVELIQKNRKDIIKILVPPSPVPVPCSGQYYAWSEGTTLELKENDLADFFLSKTGLAWDGLIEEKGDSDLLDESTLADFRRLALDRIPSLARENNVLTLLKKLNLLEDKKLKRASVLLFGKDPQQLYSHASVKIGRFVTENKVQTTDIIAGNLFQQLANSLEILKTKYLTSNQTSVDPSERDFLEYPYEALREALINALVHRDYWGFSQIQIKVYPDRLTIMNAGKLPPEASLENLKTSHPSIPQNRLLAAIFYYAGLIESWGKGTNLIVEKCLEQGLPEPEFKEKHGVVRVTFFKDKWSEENLMKLGLNERQVKAVFYVKAKKRIRNEEYRTITGIKPRLATQELNDLVTKGILEKHGTTGRGIFYAVAKAPQGNRQTPAPRAKV